MKRIVCIICLFIVLIHSAIAQNNSIQYQYIVRNSNQQLAVNQNNIEVSVAVLNEPGGASVYEERHQLNSNRNGLISFQLGKGTVISGDFAAIAWERAYVRLTTTLPGEAAQVQERPLSAVPHAYFADRLDEDHLLTFLDAHHFVDSADVATMILPQEQRLDSLHEVARQLTDIFQSIVIQTDNRVENITENEAVCFGKITDRARRATAWGLCWSESAAPTLADSHAETSEAYFSASLTALKANTLYHVRAYATTPDSTIFGEEITFTTQALCGDLAFTDIDGNLYNTVQIGTQCWMKENLRTTRYANGVAIDLGTRSSSAVPYYYFPAGDSTKKAKYGLLYNCTAMFNGADVTDNFPSGIQGPCPAGWHVPSYPEWQLLLNVVMHDVNNRCDPADSTSIAASLCDISGWYRSTAYACGVGNPNVTHNQTGLSLVAAGGFNSTYDPIGQAAQLMTTSKSSTGSKRPIVIKVGEKKVKTNESYVDTGAWSIRCVRD